MSVLPQLFVSLSLSTLRVFGTETIIIVMATFFEVFSGLSFRNGSGFDIQQQLPQLSKTFSGRFPFGQRQSQFNSSSNFLVLGTSRFFINNHQISYNFIFLAPVLTNNLHFYIFFPAPVLTNNNIFDIFSRKLCNTSALSYRLIK